MQRLSIIILILALILGLIIRVIGLNYNGPFSDEAIYIVQGLKVLDGTWRDDAPFSWVGGMPLFYPPLSAIVHNLGGIVGSRSFNVFLCILSIFFVYKIVSQMHFFQKIKDGDNLHGSIAALLFAFAPIPFWLSRLAIYDMLSVTIFLGSLLLLQKAMTRNSMFFYAASGCILALAFLAKYSILIMLPFICLFLFVKKVFIDKNYASLVFFLCLFLCLGIYFSLTYSDVLAFFTDIAVDTTGKEYGVIVTQFLEATWLWYIGAAIGTFLLQKRMVATLLFAFSLAPLIMHIITNNTASVYQDGFFSLLFLLPLASLPFFFLIRKNVRIGCSILTIAIIGTFIYTKSFVTPLENFWPNYSKTSAFLAERIGSEDIVLLEAADTIYLDLYDTLDESQVVGPYVFGYNDKEGIDAYTDAVRDGHFSYIQKDASTEELSQIPEDLILQHYDIVFEDEAIVIYQKK